MLQKLVSYNPYFWNSRGQSNCSFHELWYIIGFSNIFLPAIKFLPCLWHYYKPVRQFEQTKLKNIVIIFTNIIKVLYSLTSIFVGFNIAFMYSRMTLEISSRTNILFQAFLTSYQIDNVVTITMKDPPHIISCIGETLHVR